MCGIEEKFGIPLEAVREAAFSKQSVDPAIRGEITDEQWQSNVSQLLAKRFPNKDAEGATKFWNSCIGELIPEVLLLVEECKSVVKVALFTNATTKLNHDLEALGISDLFDYVVNASEVGSIKPESSIYQYALKLADITPNEAFFTDDKDEHVKAAVDLGWSGYVFENAAGLRTALVDAKVLS